MVDSVFDDRGVDCETVYRSDRDDWVLAMVSSGFGFGFFPKYSIARNPDVSHAHWSILSSGAKSA